MAFSVNTSRAVRPGWVQCVSSGAHGSSVGRLFGSPLTATATFVFLFCLFGAFLQNFAGGQFFIDLATGAAGKFRGGPAKVAVISSALFGTVSGSAIANVVTTGTFTIPLMKKTGYKDYFAGAVEAVASTRRTDHASCYGCHGVHHG